MRTTLTDPLTSVLRLGAAASVVQSALFVVIGLAALALGVDRLIDDGFAALASAEPTAFRILCGAFVAIAVLGVAITPAELALVEPTSAGAARFGAALAYLGHAGTIAFFSWWLLTSFEEPRAPIELDAVAPIDWGVMFELVLVGAWVWIIAAIARGEPGWPPGFVALSVVKATSFWFASAALLADVTWMIVVGLGAVTFFTGPAWHLWIARILVRPAAERPDAG